MGKKATIALLTCRRLLGKKWGLSPRMTLWSYKAIIRPMITYASLVWWPITKLKTAQMQLNKLQRLACLSITGAITTCPTAAMEALIRLTLLHIQVQKEATLGALQISRNYNLPKRLGRGPRNSRTERSTKFSLSTCGHNANKI